MQLTLEAPAKLNLCLAVEHPPLEGYHALASVFQTLDLSDTLEFSDAPVVAPCAETGAGTRVYLDCGGLDLPVADNLVFKALDRMERACGTPASAGGTLGVRVDKRIPAGGGLGGGSSDAAAAIRAYARANGIDPLDGRCLEVARGLGADVAFFLYGGCALMGGRGDVLVRRLPAFPLPLVLMGEVQGNSTAEVYAAFDGDPPPAPDADALARALEAGDASPELLASLCANNLEPAACAAAPRLAQRLAAAKASPHVLNALVTGSGSTSYAICRSEQDAGAFAGQAAPRCDWTAIAHAQPQAHAAERP